MTQLNLDATHYRKNSSVQQKLAQEVIDLHSFTGKEKILDMGCGDGKLTYELAQKSSKGAVYGIDPSPNMIKLAKSFYPSNKSSIINFSIDSAEDFQHNRRYDLITSFCSMHWVRDQVKAFHNIKNHLASQGRLLVLTFPKESPYFNFLKSQIRKKNWEKYHKTSACESWLTVSEYQNLIHDLKFEPISFHVTSTYATYADKEHFINYVKGWLPCLISIPENLKEIFLLELAEEAVKEFGSSHEFEFQIPYKKIVMYLENRQ